MQGSQYRIGMAPGAVGKLSKRCTSWWRRKDAARCTTQDQRRRRGSIASKGEWKRRMMQANGEVRKRQSNVSTSACVCVCLPACQSTLPLFWVKALQSRKQPRPCQLPFLESTPPGSRLSSATQPSQPATPVCRPLRSGHHGSGKFRFESTRLISATGSRHRHSRQAKVLCCRRCCLGLRGGEMKSRWDHRQGIRLLNILHSA
ncbi:hypothetical protein BCV69DRAFT_76644 [Microstroma glucosiphilum]|uniref:Uncharacterized protein n=1 Tax=Pseudomicrostroma glucosiphilum TaxID=1684307 RepID=A0A316TZB2_9BASI|nr:hypothetical protein BCV69DRAFT_76644 [Pseudomicrostroma glucosiphilum]PWN18522.1 hypothetical protein BCV69DRAFT_76644 [Pseudomicrostroma glucosiphilum]